MGFGSSFKSAVSNTVSSLGNMASSIAAPVRNTTTALAQVPALAAGGQNYLLNSAFTGAGALLQDPQALMQIGGAVASGGVSSLPGLLTSMTAGGGSEFGLMSLLAGQQRQPSGGVSVSVPQQPTFQPAAPTASVPVWVWVVGAVVAVGGLFAVSLMRRGRR
jgi:hypothetical protein